jgi:hypothetical protein
VGPSPGAGQLPVQQPKSHLSLKANDTATTSEQSSSKSAKRISKELGELGGMADEVLVRQLHSLMNRASDRLCLERVPTPGTRRRHIKLTWDRRRRPRHDHH